MASSSYLSLTNPVFTHHPTNTSAPHKSIKSMFIKTVKLKPTSGFTCNSLLDDQQSTTTTTTTTTLHYSLPLAASLAILLWSNPASAGFLSGSTGIESIPGPQLPEIDWLKKFNEENQKKYAEFDERFKSSPLLKEYLERSKTNKDKNKQEILDKYCIRGAEWGVGDCSTDGMTPQQRDSFIAMLKQKAGVE